MARRQLSSEEQKAAAVVTAAQKGQLAVGAPGQPQPQAQPAQAPKVPSTTYVFKVTVIATLTGGQKVTTTSEKNVDVDNTQEMNPAVLANIKGQLSYMATQAIVTAFGVAETIGGTMKFYPLTRIDNVEVQVSDPAGVKSNLITPESATAKKTEKK